MNSELNLFDSIQNRTKDEGGTVVSSSVVSGDKANKKSRAYRTISEVANQLGVATHVLRFWETKFTEIQPMKRGGGRRYYRPEDVEFIKHIQNLLHNEGYTIKGVQSLLKKGGSKTLKAQAQVEADAKQKVEATVDTHQTALQSVVRELKNLRELME